MSAFAQASFYPLPVPIYLGDASESVLLDATYLSALFSVSNRLIREMTQPSWFNTPSGTMRAAVLTSPGARAPEECFTIENTYPKPTLPSQEWVLVRVYAAGLNRAELRSRNGDKPGLPEFGLFQSEYHEDPPKILGEEFVGEVELAGSDTDFNPGEKVAGWVYGGGKPFDGSYAEVRERHPQFQ